MKSATKTRFPRPGVLGCLLIVAVLTACDAASSCDLGAFPDSPFPDRPSPNVSLEVRCADDADSGSIPSETTPSPGSEPLSGDAVALAAFYNATDGPNWSSNTYNWLTDAPISDWGGVTASNTANGRAVGECVVTSLSGNQLSGEIPAELGNLLNLESLNLNGNQLNGGIPAELGNLSNLTFLSLNGNQLSGGIPAELGNLSNLTSLNLNGNQLSGGIPAELGNLSNLTFLSLNGNQLSGGIPAELGNLSNLTSLSLDGNQLSGEIPAELGNLLNLESLSLNRNQLSGGIPAELGNLLNLESLSLNRNQLSGEIPAELGNLLNLESLSLNGNQLSGGIPAELGNLSNLTSLSLNGNQLSGGIPAELGNLSDLTSLSLNGNQLSGTIPAALGNLPNLESLDLRDNQLGGEIPIELGKIPNLGLNGNRLSGRIRPNGTNLQYAWEGSTIRVSWDAVDGADYYKVYHDDFFLDNCSLIWDDSPSFCEELATNVVGTTYVHTSPTSPSRGENYYWVVSCNSDGCSEIASKYPAITLEARSTGSFNTTTPRTTTPRLPPAPAPTLPPMPEVKSPANVRHALDGSTIRISWDPVDGADYYKVYYDDFSDSRCSLSRDGSPRFCEELAANVVGTIFVHTSPAATDNYYWVVACDTGDCSDIDSENPAAPIEPIPAGPENVTYVVEGSAIRVTWKAVLGADYYKVYYDDFSDSSCSLSRDGSPRFCEELAANVVGTTYVHTSPAARENHYWVVACNRGGCSDIDSKNPAKPIETRPNEPAAAPSSTGGAGELAQERAAELLTGELGVAVAGLKVVSTTAMTWSDASLGCPQPDRGYAQVVTPGYLVLFRDSGGTEYKVHTNEDGSSVIVCDK